jgi:hypothetical protein
VAAGAVLAARNMAAESRRAAGLDGTHDFELAKAYVAAIGLAPCGPVAAEDIRNLQRRAGHGRRPLSRRAFLCQDQPLERAQNGAQRVHGNLSIACRRIQLRVAKRTRVIMHILLSH